MMRMVRAGRDELSALLAKGNRQRYPVLYVLDAEWNFYLVCPVVQFMEQSRQLPDFLVVGVPNVDREHDLTPTPYPNEPASGGGPFFESFLNEELAREIDAKFRTVSYRILVGHSAGGLTISAVAERVPELLLAVVYLSGFMLPSGMQVFEMLQHETMSSSLGPGLFVGNPAATGATRINVGSANDAYRSRLRATFYGDMSESEFALATSQLHCDEPVGAVAPSGITPGRFGTVPRHYIRCTQDRAVPLAGQDHMIATVDGTIGGKTTIHSLDSSHSPFLSQPAALSKILTGIFGY